MASNRTPGSRPGLILCNNCGEEYSSSYRRCPFCDEFAEAGTDTTSGSTSHSSGGKRLLQTKHRRGGGYSKLPILQIIKILISLAVIAAAIWVVVTQIKPLIDRANGVSTIDPDTVPDASPGFTSAEPSVSGSSQPNTGSTPSDTPDQTSPSPGNNGSSITDGGATGFSLNESDFSINDRYPDPVTLKVTFTPAGTTGTITWTSSDPDVATVDENGTVSVASKRGSATITATLANGVTQTCIVYNLTTGSSSSDPAPSTSQDSGSTSETYTVNNSDFTFYTRGETYTLKVRNYTGGVTWTSSNTSVATVDSNGKCTAVSSGTCTVTGTLDNGSTVKAIVRVNIS